MKVVVQTNSEWTEDYEIAGENLRTGKQEWLHIPRSDPAEYIWSDDEGTVFIRHNEEAYKVRSIDLDYLEEDFNAD